MSPWTMGETDQGILNEPGFRFLFEEETTAAGGGCLRANNANLSAATALRLDHDAGGQTSARGCSNWRRAPRW